MMSPPKFSPWARLVWFGLGAAVVTGAFQTIVIAALSVAAMLSGANARTLQSEGLMRYALWITVLTYPPLFGWLMFCRHTFDRRSLLSLGLRTQGATRFFGSGALTGLLAITWLFAGLWLCGAVSFGGIGPEAFDRTASSIAGLLVLHALAFAAVGFMEELIFRGYILHNLRVSVGLRAAIWLQAVAFALVHLSNTAITSATNSGVDSSQLWADSARALPSIALIGAVFALMWAKTGSLWAPIGFHFAWNFALGCLFSLPVSGIETFRLFDFQPVGSPWISGGSFGAEGSVLLLPILAALWWLLRQSPDHPQALADLALLDPNHPNIIAEPAPAAAPQIASMEVQDEAEEAHRNSRFQTSMRPREVEATFPIVGQLPREENTPAQAPTPAPPFASSSPEPPPVVEAPAPTAPVALSKPEHAASGEAAASSEWSFQPLPEAAPEEAATPEPAYNFPAASEPQASVEQTHEPKEEEATMTSGEAQMSASDESAAEAPTPAPRRQLPRW